MIDEGVMYSEVYEILGILGPKYINRIPSQLYEYIENNRKKDYSCNINNYEPIENQNIMDETIELISLINLKYWADENERESLISIYNANEEIYNEKAREKYDPNNIFKNKTVQKEEAAMVEIKAEKWYEKLFSLIKKLFERN